MPNIPASLKAKIPNLRPATWLRSTTEFNAVLDAKRSRSAVAKPVKGKVESANLESDLASLLEMLGHNPERLLTVLKHATRTLPPVSIHKIANGLSRYADEVDRNQRN